MLLKWWRDEGEDDLEQARALKQRFLAGSLSIVVPELLFQEIINAAGRRWSWGVDELLVLADALEAAGFEQGAAPLHLIARWTARGLTAYDATYVALAEDRRIPLITADRLILELAPGIAHDLSLVRHLNAKDAPEGAPFRSSV